MDIVFHLCGKPDESTLSVSVDGEMATPRQLDNVAEALNYNDAVRGELLQAVEALAGHDALCEELSQLRTEVAELKKRLDGVEQKAESGERPPFGI